MKFTNSFSIFGERTLEFLEKKPPIPLILAGWNFSEDWQKKERWLNTLSWAKEMHCDFLIPELDPNEKYKG